MGPPSYVRPVDDGNVVMGMYNCIECTKILSLLPDKSSVSLTLHEIRAVPLRFTKKGRSDTSCFYLPFLPLLRFTSSAAHF